MKRLFIGLVGLVVTVGMVHAEGNLVPATDLGKNLGSAAKRWDNVYAENFVGAALPTLTLDGTTARTLSTNDYGKIIAVTNGAAVAITLPANGAPAGTWIDVCIGAMTGGGADACAPTVSAATADTLIGPNDVDLDSVTWGAGHRIGAYARFWSDGSFWHVQNLGGTTMTYTD